jgi:polar amino acid transport system substrate-binding protein
MRRLFAIFAVAFLLLAACNRGTPTTTATSPGGVATVKQGELTIGSDIPFEPFEFEKDGELTGFDVELVREIAKRLGLKATFVDTDFETIFTQLAAARYDMIASATTITEERKKQVAFSVPYFVSRLALTINTQRTPNIDSFDDLKSGDTLAVQVGTTSLDYANKNLKPKGVTVREFPEAPDTYNALEAEQVTAVLFDEPSAVAELEERKTLKIAAAVDSGDRYGFPINPENKPLQDAINKALQAIIDDGAYDRIFDKYASLPPSSRISKASGTPGATPTGAATPTASP